MFKKLLKDWIKGIRDILYFSFSLFFVMSPIIMLSVIYSYFYGKIENEILVGIISLIFLITIIIYFPIMFGYIMNGSIIKKIYKKMIGL